MTKLNEIMSDDNLRKILLKHVPKAPFTRIIVDEHEHVLGMMTNYGS